MGKFQLKIAKRKKAVLFESRVPRQNARSTLAHSDRAARQQLLMRLKYGFNLLNQNQKHWNIKKNFIYSFTSNITS